MYFLNSIYVINPKSTANSTAPSACNANAFLCSLSSVLSANLISNDNLSCMVLPLLFFKNATPRYIIRIFVNNSNQ